VKIILDLKLIGGIRLEKALAFIDLLGFSQMVSEDYMRATEVLDDFYNIAYEVLKCEPTIEGTLFSDCLIAYSVDKSLLLNKISEIYRQCLRKNETYDKTKLHKFFLLPRGGISAGVVNIEERMEAPNLRKGFIVSPALVHSAKLEQTIKGSRLLVAVNQKNSEDVDFNWNDNIEAILYEDNGYQFLDKYTYKDTLWFANLSKQPDDQKREINELLEIAIDLAKTNALNEKALPQHIGTLRIGILSFSRFFEATASCNLLTRLINEFSEDKYWLVWVTVFEMIMQSPDNWAVPSRQDLIAFYRKICLSNGWGNVLDYLNNPSGVYAKQLILQFIEEIDITTV
jgi:hypothetical protein